MKYVIEIDSKVLEDAKKGYVRLGEIADAVKTTATPYPQGKRVKHIDDLFPEESTEECPFCHEEQFIRLGNDDNFCPNCGADVRGGAE